MRGKLKPMTNYALPPPLPPPLPQISKRHWSDWAVAMIAAIIIAIAFAVDGKEHHVAMSVAMYFAPTIIATARSHKNTLAIFVANCLVLGGMLFASTLTDPSFFSFITNVSIVATIVTMVWSFIKGFGPER